MRRNQAGQNLSGDDAAARREAARILGSVKTERKTAWARELGRKHGNRTKGPPLKPLAEIPCSCTAGAAAEPLAHKSYCLRGQAVKRRLAKNLPLD